MSPDQLVVVTLDNHRGTRVRLCDLGAGILGIERSDGIEPSGVILSPDDERELGTFPAGAVVVGRVANRIADSRFRLDGVEHALPANEGRHHLHGGPEGFQHRRWVCDPPGPGEERSARFRIESADGDQGYPGRLDVTARYELTDDHALVLSFEAVTDRATPINLTNHAYFNLANHDTVLDHELWVDADRWLPVDAHLIPTGEIADVTGTPLDFRRPRALGERIAELEHPTGGYDHCLVFRAGRDVAAPCIRLHHANGRSLEIVTSEPAVQLYTANRLSDLSFIDGRRTGRHGAVCLETQHFPDSVHHSHFPPVILHPGQRWTSTTAFRFATE
jgi:aldose 1-epimerase